MRHGLLVPAAGALFALGTLAACNAILDFDAYGTRMVPTEGAEAGADADADAEPECSVNDECIAKLGEFAICRKSNRRCVKLVNAECPRVIGDWKNDDAVIFGAIAPLFGPDAPTGIPVENSVRLAIEDFAQGSNGLPPVSGSARRRPIVVVSCSETTDTASDEDVPARSATHLVQGVGVPAIIGAAYSGNTLRASQVTIPGGTLLMSPSATSVALTDLQDNGLVWRTSPSDVIQSAALAALMPQVEKRARDRLGLGAVGQGTNTRVTLIHKGDAYGKGLAGALQTSLHFNGKAALENGADFQVIDYGDPGSNQPPTDYPGAIGKVQQALSQSKAPHVVFLLGTNEGVDNLMKPIEALDWSGQAGKPTWLFADGGSVPALWGFVGSQDSLRQRVIGTIPGTSGTNFAQFRILYSSKINDGTSPEVVGTANAYDALYLLALATAATGDAPVTGANLAKAMARVVPPGEPLLPGATNINKALSSLAAGLNLDYSGASGPLDFDLATGEAESDIQFWCLPDSNGSAGAATSSGVFYDAAKKSIGSKVFEPLDPDVKSTCGLTQ